MLCTWRGASGAKDEDYGGGSAVFAKGSSLWKIDPEGAGPEVEIVALPGAASDVTTVRSNPDGSAVLLESAGAWYWARIDPAATAPATTEALACEPGPARFAIDGACIVCAGKDGGTLVTSIATGKSVTKKVPPEGARVVELDGVRRLVYTDADGVWSAVLKDLSDKQELAPDAPVGGFLAAPDGSRGVAVYPGHVYQKKQKVPADVLTGFVLDGTAAQRKLFDTGALVVDWSWDSQWLLVQDGEEACLARAVGGQYKCWKGYTAQSIAPDGRWGLVRGADNPHKLYRVRLEGARTDKPKLVFEGLEGAALWLPGSSS